MTTLRKTPALSNNGSVKVNDATYAEEVNANVVALWSRVAVWTTSVGGTANAITTISDVPLTAAPVIPMALWLVPTANNTSTVTINVDGQGVRNILNAGGTPLAAGDLLASTLYLLVFDGSSWRIATKSPSAAGVTAQPDFIIHDEQSSGVQGGTFTAGSWFARALNTIVRNVIAGASLSGTDFTLPVGTYYIEADAPAFAVTQHQIRLFNVTDNLPVEYGTSEYSGSAGAPVTVRSHLQTTVVVSAPHVYHIEHRCAATEATNGFGLACGFGNKEIYTRVSIWKVG